MSYSFTQERSVAPRRISHVFVHSLAVAIVLALPIVALAGGTETVMYSFGGGAYGADTGGAVVLDSAGNFYGTTEEGGNYGGLCGNFGCGTIFKLTPSSAGWKMSLIHRFTGAQDGNVPVAGLIIDSAGNLYGTASSGGTYGHGTVFKLNQVSDGGWKITALHAFRGGSDGEQPQGPLIMDAAGNLYGTTVLGGSFAGYGTVFMVAPTAEGGWKESVLYGFSNTVNGYLAEGGVTLDKNGNLYGTTAGGTYGRGNVFELTPNSTGRWTETVLYNFTGTYDGYFPYGGSLVFDSAGNLYGTTAFGGSGVGCQGNLSCGTVFKLSPSAGGAWTETVIHNFLVGTDGSTPYSGLIFDGSGNLYGTTFYGGDQSDCYQNGEGGYGCGTIFELSPNSSGGWTETTLYSFLGGKDGANPYASPVFDALGNLYGTTYSGGGFVCYPAYGCGTVFKVSPNSKKFDQRLHQVQAWEP